MRKLDRDSAVVLIAIGLVVIFALGLILGSRVQSGVHRLTDRRAEIARVIE